jgi:beta-ureidopropionase / N-carbamoyl-L-amino-acid hydrolase
VNRATAAREIRPSAAHNRWRALAVEAFDGLRKLSFDGVGITRETYGRGETEAMEFIASLAVREGLSVSTDPVQNLFIDVNGAGNEPSILVGSHLDSVPSGGNYDGAAGVVAGLLCLSRIKHAGVAPPQPVRVVALRAEESAWFQRPCIGSSALFGQLRKEDLAAKHRDGSRTLGDCMRAAGVAVDRVCAGEAFLDPKRVIAYLELHIEQGPVLVSRDLPTAIVTGIRGNVRHHRVMCIGEAGHSGVVPRWLRRDAVLAVADVLHRLEEHWRRLLEGAYDLVFTVGVLGTDAQHHSITRIPGEVGFSIDVRSLDHETLEEFHRLLIAETSAVARERNVEFKFDRRVDTPPARMHEGLIARLLDVSRELDLPPEAMPSGAGHDASVFANAGVPSAMIFVRNDHGSHNPKESMEIDDFMAGVEIMYQGLAQGLRP